MSCRVKYTEAVANKIRKTVGVDHTTAEEIYPGTILLKISSDNSKLKTKDNVLKWAMRLADKLNSMFRSDLYGTVATIDNRYLRGVILNYSIPSKLIDRYIEKYADLPKAGEKKSSENRLISDKMLSLSEFPENIIDENKGTIRLLLDDDTITLDQFKNFIEHLKNCR